MNAAPAIDDANIQWRIIWQTPGHPDVTELHSGLNNAYTAATQQEHAPEWLIPQYAYIRDVLAEDPDIPRTVASHADGRTILLSRV